MQSPNKVEKINHQFKELISNYVYAEKLARYLLSSAWSSLDVKILLIHVRFFFEFLENLTQKQMQ